MFFFNIFAKTVTVSWQYNMKQIICGKKEILYLPPALLLPSVDQKKTVRKKQSEAGKGDANHICVCAAHCANSETTKHYKKKCLSAAISGHAK